MRDKIGKGTEGMAEGRWTGKDKCKSNILIVGRKCAIVSLTIV